MKKTIIVFLIILMFYFSGYSFAEEKKQKTTALRHQSLFFNYWTGVRSIMFPDEKPYYLELLKLDGKAANFIGLYWIVKAKKESVDLMIYADQDYEDTIDLYKGSNIEEYQKTQKVLMHIRNSEKEMCIESYFYDHWDEINKMFLDKLNEAKKMKTKGKD